MPAVAVTAVGLTAMSIVIIFRFRYHRHVAMIPAEWPLATLRPAAALFRSLADPARLAIVRQLAAGPARVVDLTRALGLAQSTVSGHLSWLRDCGLVTMRPAGRASVYSLAQPALLDLLAAAQTVLEGTGSAAALDPAHGDRQPADGARQSPFGPHRPDGKSGP